MVSAGVGNRAWGASVRLSGVKCPPFVQRPKIQDVFDFIAIWYELILSPYLH